MIHDTITTSFSLFHAPNPPAFRGFEPKTRRIATQSRHFFRRRFCWNLAEPVSKDGFSSIHSSKWWKETESSILEAFYGGFS